MSDLSDAQIEKILDAYAEEASLDYVQTSTGYSRAKIRAVLEDPATAAKALARKKALLDVWFAGSVLDHLKRCIELSDKPANIMNAIRLMQQFLHDPTDAVPGDGAPARSLEDRLAALTE